jgi:hypothetical protein
MLKNSYQKGVDLVKSLIPRNILIWVTENKVLSFGDGMPDLVKFPISKIKNIVEEGLSDVGNKLLKYGSTEGVKKIEGRENSCLG